MKCVSYKHANELQLFRLFESRVGLKPITNILIWDKFRYIRSAINTHVLYIDDTSHNISFTTLKIAVVDDYEYVDVRSL